MRNLHCPKHPDSTPSVKVYSNGAWCFGGCGEIALKELGLTSKDVEGEERYVEDVEESIQRIEGLPRAEYRGFLLPTDGRGSFVVWQDRSYYKQRLYSGTPKYRGPAGVPQPPLWVRQGTSETLLVLEGELEALSAASAFEEVDVMSPGSASNFNRKLLPNLRPYSRIAIIADDDPAGIKAVIELGALIEAELPGCVFKRALKASGGTDLNDLYVQFGKERVREEVSRLLRGM